MKFTGRFTVAALATVAGLFLAFGPADTALARQGRGRGGSGHVDRVRDRVDLTIVDTTDVAPREARIRVRIERNREELKVELSRATSGFDLELWMADADGTLVQVGSFRESPAGNYEWRVRTNKGQALPFGVANIADLSERTVEVRTAGGQLVAEGALPTIAATAAPSGATANVRTVLSIDAATAATGVEAQVRISRKGGRDEFRAQVEGLESGLSLELWMDDGSGALALVGAMPEDDDGNGEYELRVRSDRDALPFGVTDVALLSGRAVEIRTADGDVVASGFVAALGERASTDDDAAGDDNGSGGGGADDPATHDAGDDNGVDDPATHDVGDDDGGSGNGNGADDPAGDDNGGGSGNSGSGNSGGGSGNSGRGGGDDGANHA